MSTKNHHDVIVAGGGPGGATVASYLAMRGYDVAVLERERFPRHRIGESLLPSMMPVLEDLGLLERVADLGFAKKTGGTFVWGRSREPWDVRFDQNPFLPFPHAYHVDRARFDEVLLDRARELGCRVREGVAVTAPVLEGDRVVGVEIEDEDGRADTLRARFVVDASGPASVIGRAVSRREYDDRMRQVAFYSYFRDVAGTGTFRDGHVTVTSCPKGWFWFIPLANTELGDASVGLVTGREFKDEYRRLGQEAFFEAALAESPQTREMLGPRATRSQPMRAITDWAYACERMAGPGWFLVGDSACFLDPMLSTGVTMAMLAGYSAAACMHTAATEPSLEADAAAFYNDNYRRMWTVTRDFLHYFYAGNATAHPDDLFWEARSTLRLGDNVGAKQAFCFMVNTIPGNPHPAVSKQIHMYQQFMRNLDHPTEAMTGDEELRRMAEERSQGWVPLDALEDGVRPVANGRLERTWAIDRDEGRLRPVRGIAYDEERPVFSSTSSWLLGRNLHTLDDASFELLERCDGERTWGDLVREHARASGQGVAEARDELARVLEDLHAERFVLLRASDAAPARVAAGAE